MVIEFPLRRREEADDAFEKKLALIMPFADQPSSLCQLLADCLVRLDRLESEKPASISA